MKTILFAPVLLTAVLSAPLPAQEGTRPVDLLVKIVTDANADVRLLARVVAPEIGAAAVAPLGDLLSHERREAVLTARAALERVVHRAGRSDAESERGPVALELAKLLAAERPAAVKREALHLIAFIGGDSVVPPVTALLGDSDARVREAARLSLERIPGKAAVAALLEAAKTAPPARKPDLIFSLSKKGDLSVAEALSGFASAGENEVRFAALEGLARLGAPGGVALIAGAIDRAEGFDKEKLFTEYLRLADGLRAKDPATAQSMYRRTMGEAPVDYLREQALGSACPPGKSEALPLLVSGLTDPAARVRRIAAHRLQSLHSPEVLAALSQAFEGAKGSERPLLLRAIADRDPEAAKPYLERARNDSQVELKITALDLLSRLDDPELEPVYLRTAESGVEWLRPTALKGYLLLARRKADGAKKEEALPMFERVLDLARDAGQRLEALRGIVSVGGAKAMERLVALIKDSQLGTEAARGYVSLAAAIGNDGDRAGASKQLEAIIGGEFPQDLKGKAAEAMKGLGFDPQRAAHAQGFVVDFWLVGPLQDPDGKGLERKYFPEEVIDLETEHRIEARRYRWQKLTDKVLSLDGRIDLIPVFRRSEKCVAYAYREIELPAPREVLFKMGSDDGIACWLNGARIHASAPSRGYKVDEDTVKARLPAGKNKVLLKITQTNGDWAFSFRITDPEGKPIDLTAKVD